MRKLTLMVKWSKKEDDFIVYYPSKSTGGYVIDHLVGKRTKYQIEQLDLNLWESEKFLYKHGGYNFIEHDFIKEMASRGFDVKTLKFSIKIDPNQLKEKFPHIYDELSKEDKKKLGIK